MALVWVSQQKVCYKTITNIKTPVLFMEAIDETLVSNKKIRELYEALKVGNS